MDSGEIIASLSFVPHDGQAAFLALIPVPLVDLTFSESKLGRHVAYVVPLPVGVLFKLSLEHAELVLVLALPALDVATCRVLVLRLLKERGHAVV